MSNVMYSSMYDALCSSIEAVRKRITDDTPIASSALFSRFTVKVRTLGTNNYIGIGSASQNFRFTAAQQSMTFIAPVMNGTVIPLKLDDVYVMGNVVSGAGILEITGVRIHLVEGI